MKIRPHNDRVVVRRLEEETTTAGGIVIPDAATEEPSRGEVLAVGPGKPIQTPMERHHSLIYPAPQELNVYVGDKVVFTKYSGTEVEVDGEMLVIMNENDILGFLED